MGKKQMADAQVNKAKVVVNQNYKDVYGFNVPENYVFKTQKGLNEDIVAQISDMKGEPTWMKEFRLRAYRIFKEKPTPTWGGDLSKIDYDNIYYYLKPTDHAEKSWEDVPQEMKETFDRLGIPQAERQHLAGVKAQFDSEVIYDSLMKELEEEGIIFLSTDDALKRYPHFFEEYFGKIIPPTDNKFAALNSAVWSGGSFVYIPKGAHVKRPLQAYFRINAINMGQFERTLIIADEGSYAHYVEGCFTVGHAIKTKSGLKNIENIEVDDEVLTHTGAYERVYHTQERPYTGNLYEIDVYNLPNSKVNATEEHPFLVSKRNVSNIDSKVFAQEWVSAVDLEVGDYIGVPTEGLLGDKPRSAVSVGNYTWLEVESINKKRVENVLVYNFSVEDDESYICNGVAVHNCTAPVYSTDSLHSAVVEVIVKPGARFRYTTIQNWSNDVYNLVTKRARVDKDAIMEWVDGNLGCLTGDSEIFLNNKVKKIKDVQTNDYVYSLNENMEVVRNKVLGTKYSGKQKVYELVTENRRIVNATANHPFLVLRKDGKQSTISWQPLENINVEKDLVAISGEIPDNGKSYKIEFSRKKGTKKNITVPSETTEDLMWLLGFYIGDGYYDKNRVYFAVPESDKSQKRVISLLKEIFDLDHEIRLNVVRTSSVNLKEFIQSLGFVGDARTKRVPEWVYTLPKNQKLAFINGYIDADGYRRDNHKNISITSVSRALLEDIKTLALTCGLNPRKISKWTRKEKKPLGKETKVYEHYFLYFGEQVFDKGVYFSTVSAINPLGIEDTYDIEVEGAHNFVANGVFVHNSRLTMKYPSCYLVGENARGEVLSIAYGGKGQHQDAGAKMMHLAPNTSSKIISKSVSANGGRTSYRGMVVVSPSAKNAKSRVECDALILDSDSASDTFPVMKIDESSARVEHEATVSKIGEESLFYLMSRGLTEEEAMGMVVSGFIEPIVKELPLEYAVELNRLIELEMEGSVG